MKSIESNEFEIQKSISPEAIETLMPSVLSNIRKNAILTLAERNPKALEDNDYLDSVETELKHLQSSITSVQGQTSGLIAITKVLRMYLGREEIDLPKILKIIEMEYFTFDYEIEFLYWLAELLLGGEKEPTASKRLLNFLSEGSVNDVLKGIDSISLTKSSEVEKYNAGVEELISSAEKDVTDRYTLLNIVDYSILMFLVNKSIVEEETANYFLSKAFELMPANETKKSLLALLVNVLI